jgi:L-threonylcarbamoyladenylate synthase
MPDSPALRVALKHTGPIVAPSANPEGLAPARTLAEAKEYFGTEVDFYVDGGEASLNPSTIIRDRDGRIEIVRPGAVEIRDASLIPVSAEVPK